VGPTADHPGARRRAGDFDHRRPREWQRDLVNLSQVVLCLELPFAMFPLLQFTSSRKRMGKWRNGWFLLIAGWGTAILITAMDVFSLPDALRVIAGH
jgi:manganese transport protein